jgi:gamma-tubulin complex component 2
MDEMLSKYEQHFNKSLKVLLDALNYLAATETATFMNLCARLSTATGGADGSAGVATGF